MSNLTSANNHTRFFINDFDNEDFDALLINVVDAVFDIDTTVMEFWVNSEGGDAKRAFALVELIDLAKRRGITVETFVLCDAHSAGSIVAVAGSAGHRWVAQNGSYLLHFGVVEMDTATTPIAARRMGKAAEKHFYKIMDHYRKYTNIPEIEIRLANDNFYFYGRDAVIWGVADGLLEDYE